MASPGYQTALIEKKKKEIGTLFQVVKVSKQTNKKSNKNRQHDSSLPFFKPHTLLGNSRRES